MRENNLEGNREYTVHDIKKFDDIIKDCDSKSVFAKVCMTVACATMGFTASTPLATFSVGSSIFFAMYFSIVKGKQANAELNKIMVNSDEETFLRVLQSKREYFIRELGRCLVMATLFFGAAVIVQNILSGGTFKTFSDMCFYALGGIYTANAIEAEKYIKSVNGLDNEKFIEDSSRMRRKGE